MMKLRSTFADWRAWLLWTGPALLVVGFVTERMWRSLPAARAFETLLLSAVALAISFAASRLLRMTLATSIACVFFVAAICFIGVLPVLSALLLGAAALSIGHWITGDRSVALPAVVGASAIFGTAGWLLPFPLHYRFVYFLLFLALVVTARRRLAVAMREFANVWQSAARESPNVFAFAILVIGLATAACWLPTVQFDDLAYHLGLPAQLSELHYYRMDVQSQIWALAPWSGDVAQAIVQLLADTESRGAVDALWLLLIGALTWNLTARLNAPTDVRCFAVALAASQPLTASLVGGMQAELPATAAVLALALNVLQSERTPNVRGVVTFALIAGLLLALKTGFIAVVVASTVWFWWRCRGQWTPRLVVAGVIVALFSCGSSYTYAALITGDPFYPLFSDLFQARFPANVMHDPHWTAPVRLSIPWDLTFHTDRFIEGWNGAAGFSLLGLLGAAVLALFSRSTRALAACAAFVFITAISTVHYFRYAYPALMLFLPATVVAVAMHAPARAAAILFSSLIVLNLTYQSCAYWTLHVGGIKHWLIDRDSVAEIERYAPSRGLVQNVRERSRDAVILFCSPEEPFAAELAGRGLTVSHYDPELERARVLADADPTGSGWHGIFERANAQYAIVSRNAVDANALTAALDDAQMIREIGSDQLWQLPPQKSPPTDLVRDRDIAREKFWP
jgi:hypothetical protein